MSGTHADAPDGLLLAVGDGIRAGAMLHGASVLDVAPTILYLMGLPVARDMEGRVLTEMLDERLRPRPPRHLHPQLREPGRHPGRRRVPARPAADARREPVILSSSRMATVDDFLTLDVRVGTVVSAEVLRGARKPAFALRVDFGRPGHARLQRADQRPLRGRRTSSACR